MGFAKLVILGFLFVISTGGLFSRLFNDSKILRVLIALFSIISVCYLLFSVKTTLLNEVQNEKYFYQDRIQEVERFLLNENDSYDGVVPEEISNLSAEGYEKDSSKTGREWKLNVKLFEPGCKKKAITLGANCSVSAISWSNDGSKLAVGSDNGSLLIWELSGDKFFLVYKKKYPGDAESNLLFGRQITELKWSADNKRVAVLYAESIVRVFRLNDKSPISTIKISQTAVGGLNFDWNKKME